ncbi:hypothetical protein WN55_01266 [Dufourea novaeangliae]|uniref:Uncharacterized protein n=1 Tax=Dufourea novaeangliae TaxID=178035 RepID=A0A154NWD5_DUFNO|nr:hypothetical protein WN55_01266 [Dufourea novaeangliae]
MLSKSNCSTRFFASRILQPSTPSRTNSTNLEHNKFELTSHKVSRPPRLS